MKPSIGNAEENDVTEQHRQVEGEFTKWLRKWMLRSEKSRTIRGQTSRTDSKNDMRMIEGKSQSRTDVVRRAAIETSRD